MTQTRQKIDFINTTYDEVEQRLLGGQTPAEVAEYLTEPVPNVMGVWADLRNRGDVDARNFTQKVATRQEPTMTQPPQAPHTTTSELLARARQLDHKTIQTAVKRVDTAIERLSEVMTKHESQARARLEISRLERALADAKAKLRGGVSTKPAGTPPSGSYECRKGCGKVSPNSQGRAAHERFCTRSAA